MAQQTKGLGRPRVASQEDRANNYKDANGRDILVGGLKPWHIRIVDFMVANPHAKIVDIAEEFRVTPQWMSRLMKTDAFEEYYRRRMEDHQGLVGEEIISRMQSVAVRSLDELHHRLDNEPEKVSFDHIRAAADSTLKALGYTTSKPTVFAAKVEQNVIYSAPREAVERAREKLANHMKTNTEKLSADEEAYRSVTSAMDVSLEDMENKVEDAVLVEENLPPTAES